MLNLKNRRAVGISIIACAIVLILLGIIYAITDSFIVNAIIHIYIDLLIVPILIIVLKKCFKNQLTQSLNKALTWCSAVIVLDMVIIENIRYILSNGVSTILFLPPFIPLCFMIIMSYSTKDTGRDKKAESEGTYIIGIPLLLLALYFEVLSFIQI